MYRGQEGAKGGEMCMYRGREGVCVKLARLVC